LSLAGIAFVLSTHWDFVGTYPVEATGLASAMVFSFGLSYGMQRVNAGAERQMLLRESLIREIHHRLKNEANVLLGLLEMEKDAARTDEAREVISRERQRVAAILGTHNHLYKTEEFTFVPMKAYLGELVGALREAVLSPESEIQTSVSLSRVELRASEAMILGIVVSELFTNSVKHGLIDGTGTIEVALYTQGTTLVLEYLDDGVGFRETPRGFGSQLIENLLQSLKAEVSIDGTHGFQARIRFPRLDLRTAPEAQQSGLFYAENTAQRVT
jgi:two-component sensor histidine kinase